MARVAMTLRRARRAPAFDPLEPRTLLSAFYALTSVASTAGGRFTGFGNLPATSRNGNIAFVGSTGNAFGDSGIYVQESGSTSLVNINPTFSADPSRSFGRQAAINNDGLVTAREQQNTDPSQFRVREWNSNTPDSNTILSRIPTTDPSAIDNQYSGLLTFTDVNDRGDIAFVSQSGDTADRLLQYVGHGNVGTDTYTTIADVPAGTNPAPRPQLDDLGRVLFYSADDHAIELLDPSGGGVKKTVIASAGVGGFQRLGYAPGISANGEVFVFTGDRGKGTGVFAAYFSGGTERIVRIAGEGLDNFVAFDPNQAVQVGGGSMGTDDRGVTVAFVGTNQSMGEGLYTARLSFFGASPDAYNPAAVASTLVSGIEPAARLLDKLPDGKTIDQIQFGFGLDDRDRGRLVFWVHTTDGTQEIMKAEPYQVVFVDFSPRDGSTIGLSAANLATMAEVGVTDLGVTDGMVAALGKLGLSTDFDKLKAGIVAAVQQKYSATGANILIVGGDAPPPSLDYIPEPVLDSRGKPVVAGGAQVLSGAYKTVEVIGGSSIKYSGLATAPAGAGPVDYYNQGMDDDAFVLVNTIFQSAAFPAGTAISSLDPKVVVEAISDTVAHEAGHTFGLFHLRKPFDDSIMHDGTLSDEYDTPQTFQATAYPVPLYNAALATVKENSANRLLFATDQGGDGPNPILLKLNDDGTLRAKLALPASGSVAVKDLVVGIVPFGDSDATPTFVDLGGGDLATLLNDADLPVGPDDSVFVIGSTTGTAADIVSVAQGHEGDQDSFASTILGVLAASADAAPVSGSGAALHFYQLSGGKSVDLGLAPVLVTPVNHPPTLATIANQVVTPGTAVTFKAAATDPDSGQAIVYSLDPGAPTGATIDPKTGAFSWTPTMAQAGRVASITVRATDSGSPALSASQVVTLNVQDPIRVLGTTLLAAPSPGPMKIAIDFGKALKPSSAQVASLYKIVGDSGESVPIASAAYSDNGSQHRVVLTVASGAKVTPDLYHVSINAAGLADSAGSAAASGADQLWADVESTNTLLPIQPQPDGSFAAGAGLPLGYEAPQQVVAGNFTGSGLGDLVVNTSYTNQWDLAPLVLLRNNGDGTYAAPVPITVPGSFTTIKLATTDWNGDGIPDLVVTGYTGNYSNGIATYYEYVLLDDGHGNFSDAPDTPIPLTGLTYGANLLDFLGVADLDGDGHPEIVHLGPATGKDFSVEVIGKDPFLGYGPTMELPLGLNNGGQDLPVDLKFADLNGDGKADIIARDGGYYADNPGITVFLSTPTGYGPALQLIQPFGAPTGVGAGAFTGAGHEDIALTYDDYRNSEDDANGNVIQIFQNDGRGNFTGLTPLGLGRRDTVASAFGDLNNDGHPDVVLLLSPAPLDGYKTVTELSTWTFLGDGRGGFTPATAAPIPLGSADQSYSYSLSLADLDHDGHLDAVLGSGRIGEVRYALNDGSGAMRPPAAFPRLGNGPQAQGAPVPPSVAPQAYGDFNGDSLTDVASVGTASNRLIQVYLARPGGGYTLGQSLVPPADYPGDINWLKAGDLNRDGIPDLIGGPSGGVGPGMLVFLGNGDGTFRRAPTPVVSPGGNAVLNATLADVNGDGNLDAVVVLGGSGSGNLLGFAVCFGDGAGNLVYNANTFIPAQDDIFQGLPQPAPTLGDFNGDGKLDLLVPTIEASTGNVVLTAYNGKGNGLFTAGSVVFDHASQETTFLLGDFNGDGALDILSYEAGVGTPSDNVRFYLGDKKGGFQAAPWLGLNVTLTENGLPYHSQQMAVGDFNGDGKLDLAVEYYSDKYPDQVAVYEGDGTGHFAAPLLATTGSQTYALVSVPGAPRLDAGTVAVADRAPAPAGDAATVAAGSSVTIPVLANDADPDGDTLAVTAVGAAAHGTVHVSAASGSPVVIYAPAAGYTGTDQFTYTVTDPAGLAATASVAITVTASGTGGGGGGGGGTGGPVATSLSVPTATGAYGGAVTLAAVLSVGGTPLPGRTVAFTIERFGFPFPVGTATTDGQGVATLGGVSVAGLNAGTFFGAIGAAFAGDSSDLASSGSGELAISRATPTLTWPRPAGISFGMALNAVQLDATASVLGTFAYSPAAGSILPPGGGEVLTATFTPADLIDYATATITTTIDVASSGLRFTPVITWPAPAAIVAGTALGPAQLDATASYGGVPVPGFFSYSPGPGAVLGPGAGQALAVHFSPFDAADYNDATGTTTIDVGPPPSSSPPVVITGVHVQTVRLTKRKTATEIVVSFSGTDNLPGAGVLANFHLYAARKVKKAKVYSKPVGLTSATYNRAGETVALLPKGGKLSLKTPLLLQVTAAGIVDAEGRELDGNGDGQAGDDYKALLSRKGVQPMAIPAVASPAIARPGRPIIRIR
ncbi:FG-GAP-like repeat-containing protein [Aquisphaera giovannonii]|nr:FG-GAP-like repeat-containing protein [Aquisphaera giovannonii]